MLSQKKPLTYDRAQCIENLTRKSNIQLRRRLEILNNVLKNLKHDAIIKV